ncbi:MAG: hypothetical protein AAGA30_21715, partial [Planctomycetota bacterium]
SKTMPADNLELVVAKRVPVRLAVQMDEREIPNFLAACANSPFAFEVWQVRINKHDPEEVIKLRGGSEEDGFGGGVGPSSTRGTGTDGSQRVADIKVALRENYDVGVEFYGIVKIYNPVNKSAVGRDDTAVNANP